jgi:hypothetical protein
VWLFEKFTKLNAFEGKSAIARGLVIVPSFPVLLALTARGWGWN